MPPGNKSVSFRFSGEHLRGTKVPAKFLETFLKQFRIAVGQYSDDTSARFRKKNFDFDIEILPGSSQAILHRQDGTLEEEWNCVEETTIFMGKAIAGEHVAISEELGEKISDLHHTMAKYSDRVVIKKDNETLFDGSPAAEIVEREEQEPDEDYIGRIFLVNDKSEFIKLQFGDNTTFSARAPTDFIKQILILLGDRAKNKSDMPLSDRLFIWAHVSNDMEGNMPTLVKFRPIPHSYDITDSKEIEIYKKCIARISILEKLERNWDGYGGQIIKPEVIALAKENLKFIFFIARETNSPLVMPDIFPIANGNIQFDWTVRNSHLEIEFDSENACEVLEVSDEGRQEQEDIEFKTPSFFYSLNSILWVLRKYGR